MMTRKEQIEARIEAQEVEIEEMNDQISKGDCGLKIIDDIRETMMLIDELQGKLLEENQKEESIMDQNTSGLVFKALEKLGEDGWYKEHTDNPQIYDIYRFGTGGDNDRTVAFIEDPESGEQFEIIDKLYSEAINRHVFILRPVQ